MAAGLEGRTLAEKIADPNRPTWEEYKKVNEDKLDMVGDEVRKMVEYRAKLDKEREDRLKQVTQGKKNNAISSDDDDSDSHDEDSNNKKKKEKKEKKHKKHKKEKKEKKEKHKKDKKRKRSDDEDEDDSNSDD